MPSFGKVRRARPGIRSAAHVACVVTLVVSMLPVQSVFAQSSQAADLFQQARAREAELRKESRSAPSLSSSAADLHKRMRTLARTYEDLWRLFPTSAYSDDALWHGAMLAGDAFRQFGDPGDRLIALRLFQAITANFPTSSLLKRVPGEVARLESVSVAAPPPSVAVPTQASQVTSPPPPSPTAASAAKEAATTAPTASRVSATTAATAQSVLTGIRREVLTDALRVTLELDREPTFASERIDGPPRVFIDLQSTRASIALKDAVLPFADDVVRQIRVGRQLNGRTRVVLDLAGAGKYSVYSLYNPYRIVVDFDRRAGGPPTQLAAASRAPVTTPPVVAAPVDSVRPSTTTTTVVVPRTPASADKSRATPAATAAKNPADAEPVNSTRTADSPKTQTATAPAAVTAPTQAPPLPLPPAANSGGAFSLSRQLGLGIARIVIDPGHGGHDPGAQVRGLNEADLTLDIALRLEKLLAKQAGVEVILTRRDDVFVQLQERTAIANRAGADLFLSIHANASEDSALRGIETYFLNLSPNPEAGRIAARENATSSKTMHDFADIVKAIALNDKIDESRDFAAIVQSSLYDKLRVANTDARNLGVKQAPFMVLIGATMPSILAEVSFITNKQEGSLLKTEKYRQQIAEALFQGVMRYQQSLKKAPSIAMDTTPR